MVWARITLTEDEVGNLWILAYSPIVGLVKYDRETGALTTYPFGAGAVGLVNSKLRDDGERGYVGAVESGPLLL